MLFDEITERVNYPIIIIIVVGMSRSQYWILFAKFSFK